MDKKQIILILTKLNFKKNYMQVQYKKQKLFY
jgi:hypothetical protein